MCHPCVQEEYVKTGQPVGLDVSSGKSHPFYITTPTITVHTGEALLPTEEGIFDNYRVKKTLLHSW